MSRRSSQSDQASVSLFPFLAVLLCTMGSLVVILVLLSRQVKASAVDSQRQLQQQVKAEAPDAAERKLAREGLDWQIEQLADARAKTAEELQANRMTLSNLEDQIRRLNEKLAELDRAGAELTRAQAMTDEQRARAEADLARMRQRVEELAADLQYARTNVQSRPRSYSIIPYEGPNKTLRRPIFIECTADAVRLMPEGIELSPTDFEEPLGPGNPLAAALRAAREHIVDVQQGGSTQGGDPYPLLLVRPSGVVAYYNARAAIKSWDADFGYELVGEDWKLAYPPADPRLAQVMKNAVDQGRDYQYRMALAAPSKYQRRAPTYRAAPHRGGIIREGGSGGDGGLAGGDGPESSGRRGSFAAQEQREGSGGRGSAPQAKTNAERNGAGKAGAKQGAQGGTVAGGASQAPGSSAGGQGMPGATQFDTAGERHSKSRGKNWALPDANNRAVAITRTVRVICQEDRYVIVADRAQEINRTIMLKPRTGESIDEFVSGLWDHMKTWGIAGNGLFWRPVLVLQVHPGGEGRARDLASLLADSGVEVRETAP